MNPQNTIEPTLAEIERRTKFYADARADLAAVVAALNDKIDRLKRQALPELKRLVGRAAGHASELRFTIETAPHLFERPRTAIFHGIKVGFQKEKGRIEIDDPDDTIARLKRIFGDDAARYIHTKETPDKDALADLPVADAKRIGCRIVDAVDNVVIRPTDTAVDKLVDALLAEAVADELTHTAP